MGIAVWLGGCADAQMQYNVVSYDNTVADTANQSILLNAVRASQHYPMSFTSVGELAASPPVSGSLGGTFNFSNNGLTGITASPGVSASGGYTTFALNNLNFRDFMEALREPISMKIVNSFYQNTTWPREMIWLIYVQQLNLPKELVEVIDTYRKRECPPDDRKGLCGPINYNIGLYYSENCGDHFIDINKRLLDIKDPGFYYNTASNPCTFFADENSFGRNTTASSGPVPNRRALAQLRAANLPIRHLPVRATNDRVSRRADFRSALY